MTIEEKARAYDEALKWMRELYPGLHGATKEDAEHFFPELRESEDERIRQKLIHIVNKYRSMVLDGDDKAYDDCLAYLEVRKEPAPAEWSEEDEKHINLILRVLDIQQCWDGATGKKFNPYQGEIDWLKSLRPRPSWKPSEEQMRALIDIICFGKISYVGQEEELIALKNQLLKLM